MLPRPLLGLELELSEAAVLLLGAAALVPMAVADPDDINDPGRQQVLESLASQDADSHQVLVALGPTDRTWQDQLSRLAQDVPRSEVDAAGACLAVHNPALAWSALCSGPVQRRIDAALDVLEVPFSANDAQATASEQAAALAEVELPALWGGASLVAAFVGGVHGVPGAGGLSQRGMLWWLGRQEADEALLERLAAALLQCRAFAGGEPESWSAIQELNARWLQELEREQRTLGGLKANTGHGPTAAVQKGVQVRQSAACALQEMFSDAERGLTHQMPDVIGHCLSDAKRLLALNDIKVTDRDAAPGSSRWIASADNWRVSEQHPAAGVPKVHGARLSVLKFTDAQSTA